MKDIKIYHQINSTLMHIYYFNISKNIEYLGLTISRRKNNNDLWGHEWYSYYESNQEHDIRKLKEKYNIELHEYSHDDMLYETDACKEYDQILKKYNPVCNYIDDNHPYCRGVFGPSAEKPLISEQEIKDRICIIINKMHLIK